jgi:hypothetical protein
LAALFAVGLDLTLARLAWYDLPAAAACLGIFGFGAVLVLLLGAAGSLWDVAQPPPKGAPAKMFAWSCVGFAAANAVCILILLFGLILSAPTERNGQQSAGQAVNAAHPRDWVSVVAALLGFGVPVLLCGSVGIRILTEAEAESGGILFGPPEFHPGDPAHWYHHAVAQLEARNVAGYRATCAGIRERFGKTADAATAARALYACLLLPEVSPGDQLVTWAVVAASIPEDSDRLLGAAHYRAGAYATALPYLENAGAAGSARPWDWLFLAMARHRLGHAGEARADLDKAIRWSEDTHRQEAAGQPTWWARWSERVESQHLRREAEAMIRVDA